MKSVDFNFNHIPSFGADRHNKALFAGNDELKKFYSELANEFAAGIEQSSTFAEVVYGHIKRKGVNKIVFESKTLLSGKLFDRIKSNNLPTPSLSTVMSICIGLEITGEAAEDLLNKAGFRLGNSLLHQVYRKFLYSLKGRNIYDCNEILEALNLPLIKAKENREMQKGLPHAAV